MLIWTIIVIISIIISIILNIDLSTNYILNSRGITFIVLVIIGVFCLIYYLLLKKKYGKNIRFWLLLFILILIRSGIVLFINYMGYTYSSRTYLIVHSICLGIVVYIIGIGVLIIYNAFKKCPKGMDYLIIHGARTGTRVLNNRIKVAYNYLLENPNTIVIGTGGQGKDEDMPEGIYIHNYLVDKGISEDRILVEDKSRDTIENLLYSAKLIEDIKNKKIALVSDDYHIYRCRMTAKKYLGIKTYSIPAHSVRLSLIDSIVRELLSTIYHFIKGDIR